MKELFIHVGYGKTGTSAIQTILEENRPKLTERGVAALHRSLSMKRHGPAAFPNANAFRDSFVRAKRGEGDFVERVGKIIRFAADRRIIKKVVWSNEGLLSHSQAIAALIDSLDDIVQTKVVIYLRNHIDWLISGYMQWGVKHKTAKGRVPTLSDFAKSRMAQMNYTEVIEGWQKAIGKDRVIVRSYDQVDDVVMDFLSVCGITLGKDEINSRRVYATPATPVLSLFKIYNDQFEEPVRSRPLQSLLIRAGVFDARIHKVDPDLLRLEEGELDQVQELAREQARLLARDHDVVLSATHKPINVKAPDPQAMQHTDLISLLTAMCVNLHMRVIELERPGALGSEDDGPEGMGKE